MLSETPAKWIKKETFGNPSTVLLLARLMIDDVDVDVDVDDDVDDDVDVDDDDDVDFETFALLG